MSSFADSGQSKQRGGDLFVVQLHQARTRHFDVRLQVGPVLASWAVPKGPSLRAGERRLAVQVEDHPLDYADFEGRIPEGQYGAGEVRLVERGRWHPDGDPAQALAAGKLEFELAGRHLRGRWTLVRTGRDGQRAQWLLIKRRDRHAADTDLDALLATDPAAAGPTTQVAVRISHPERRVFQSPAIRKQDVADYYRAVAPWLLPGIVGRPLSILRAPEGVPGPSFFQKHAGPGLGDAVQALSVRERSGRRQPYLMVQDLAGLLQLVQANAIEFHPWGAQPGDVEQPDRMVFDLDPAPDVGWPAVLAAARAVRAQLRQRGLAGFPMLSGGKGVHVVVPLAPGQDWPRVKAFSRAIAQSLARQAPTRYLATAGKAERGGRIFIDWLRNARGATSIAAWSLRARPGAKVAMPLRWDELGRMSGADHYDLRSARRRAAALRGHPWGEAATQGQVLPAGD